MHTFDFSGLAGHGYIPRDGITLVLDTNVVSALLSLASVPFRPEDRRHIKALHLLHWLHGRPSAKLDLSLDLLEGSSYHRGGIDSFNLARRSLAVRALLSLAPEELEEVTHGRRTLAAALKLQEEAAVRAEVARVEGLLPWVFLPSYLVALHAMRHFDPRAPEQFADHLVQLADRLPVLPDAPALAGLLLAYGTPAVRQLLGDGLFKLRRRNRQRSAMSAGWDLALVEYASLLLGPGQVSPSSQVGEVPVVVTEDKALGQLLRWVHWDPRRQRLCAAPDALDPTLRERYEAARRRLDAHIVADFADGLLDSALRIAITDIESEMGLEPAPLTVWPKPTTPETNWTTWRFLLGVLAKDWPDIFSALETRTEPFDLVADLVKPCLLLLHDNAAARSRSVPESLVALLKVKERDVSNLLPSELLVATAADPDRYSISFNALLQREWLEDDHRYTVVGLIGIMRNLVHDTAIARGVPPELIVLALLANLDAHGL